MSIFTLLCHRGLRYPLLIAVVMHLSQQLSGINCVSFLNVFDLAETFPGGGGFYPSMLAMHVVLFLS